MEYKMIDKHEAAKIIGLKPRTLKSYRDRGLLLEEIHWFKLNSRKIVYNKHLLLDWVINKNDYWVINKNDYFKHEKAIKDFFTNYSC